VIDFRNKIGELNPSDKVNLVVMRDGKLIKLSITLGLSNEVKKQVSSTTSTNEFGIKVESMSAELRNTYRVSNDASGVLITKIDENSSMSSSGLNVGDVVFQIENKIISTPDEFYDELRKSKELKRFYVKRQNRTFMIVSQ
jgi:serine protease Do